jgi:hypothetical protein
MDTLVKDIEFSTNWYSLLNPVQKILRINSLQNVFIQIFERHKIISNEQTQKDENPLSDLIPDTELKHPFSCPTLIPPPPIEVRLQYSAAYRQITTTTLLGTEHTDKLLHIRAITYNFIYQYINNFLQTHTSCISGCWYHKHTHSIWTLPILTLI